MSPLSLHRSLFLVLSGLCSQTYSYQDMSLEH